MTISLSSFPTTLAQPKETSQDFYVRHIKQDFTPITSDVEERCEAVRAWYSAQYPEDIFRVHHCEFGMFKLTFDNVTDMETQEPAVMYVAAQTPAELVNLCMSDETICESLHSAFPKMNPWYMTLEHWGEQAKWWDCNPGHVTTYVSRKFVLSYC